MKKFEVIAKFLRTGNFLNWGGDVEAESISASTVKLPAKKFEEDEFEVYLFSNYLLYLINLDQKKNLNTYSILEIMKSGNYQIMCGLYFVLSCVEKFRLLPLFNIVKCCNKHFQSQNMASLHVEQNGKIFVFDFKEIYDEYIRAPCVEFSDLILFNSNVKRWSNDDAFVITEKVDNFVMTIRRAREIPHHTLVVENNGFNVAKIFSVGSRLKVKSKKSQAQYTYGYASRNQCLSYTNTNVFTKHYLSSHFVMVCAGNNCELVIELNSHTEFAHLVYEGDEFDLSDMLLRRFLPAPRTPLLSTLCINKKVFLFNNMFSVYDVTESYIYSGAFFNFDVSKKLSAYAFGADTILSKNTKHVSRKESATKMLKNIYGNNFIYQDIFDDILVFEDLNLFEYDHKFFKKLKYEDGVNINNYDNDRKSQNRSNDCFTKIIFNKKEYYKKGKSLLINDLIDDESI